MEYVEAVGEAVSSMPQDRYSIQNRLVGESLATNQLDFAAKRKIFEVSFMDETGTENGEVFVIHRAPLSTMRDSLPSFWSTEGRIRWTYLSPIQVQIITISENAKEYAREVSDALKIAGIRVKVDDSDNTIGKKIRTHRKNRSVYMVILGDDEMGETSLSR